jgi:hypothetical protein
VIRTRGAQERKASAGRRANAGRRASAGRRANGRRVAVGREREARAVAGQPAGARAAGDDGPLFAASGLVAVRSELTGRGPIQIGRPKK